MCYQGKNANIYTFSFSPSLPLSLRQTHTDTPSIKCLQLSPFTFALTFCLSLDQTHPVICEVIENTSEAFPLTPEALPQLGLGANTEFVK